MRQTLTTAGELTGAALLTTGCALVAVPLGLIVGGLFVGLFSWLASHAEGNE